jgi:hypothetical protein
MRITILPPKRSLSKNNALGQDGGRIVIRLGSYENHDDVSKLIFSQKVGDEQYKDIYETDKKVVIMDGIACGAGVLGDFYHRRLSVPESENL